MPKALNHNSNWSVSLVSDLLNVSNVVVTKGIGAQTIKVTSTHIPLEYGERAAFKGSVKPNLLLSGTTESNQLPFKLVTVVVSIEMETDHYYIQYTDQA